MGKERRRFWRGLLREKLPMEIGHKEYKALRRARVSYNAIFGLAAERRKQNELRRNIQPPEAVAKETTG